MLTIGPAITWIKVEKPTFDLVGVVLGIVFGAALIVSRRRPLPGPLDAVSLHLDS
jgi:hypothetical protein